MNHIAFPGLGLSFYVNPVAFRIFGKDIYWYGIIIAVGFLVAIIYATREAKRVGESTELVTDLVLWGTPIAIICARAYYVIFSWDYYSTHPAEIIAIWNGGLAIYGGIIGGLLTGVVYCKIKKKSFLKVADIVVPGFLIGQAIGRWGNFVNMEAYGSETTLPWRMEIFSQEAGKIVSAHPTFLYESLWNFVGFILMLFIRKRKPYDGFELFCYMIWYGFGRMCIEGLRTDSLYLGSIRISQLVAFLSMLAGIAFLIYMPIRKNRIEWDD